MVGQMIGTAPTNSTSVEKDADEIRDKSEAESGDKNEDLVDEPSENPSSA